MHPLRWFPGWRVTVCAAAAALMSQVRAEVFDVRSFGAKGDGIASDTPALQAAIDRCAGQGGGEVRVPPGRYLTGSLELRSGVCLHLEEKATLVGSSSMDDYRRGPLLFADEARGVVVEGRGEIDASGGSFWERDKPYAGPVWRGTAQFEYRALRRPSCLRFQRCENLALRDITIRNSPSWTVHLERCKGVKVERLTIRNPLHGPNTDGIDINSCQEVLVDSCDIVTGDDGVVLKSTEPGRDHPSRNITVSRCRVMSACNALKIGTETHGDFTDIVFRDCELYCSSDRVLDRALSGVAIESVDGSRLKNIRVENITMSHLRAPIFVRLGHRGGNSPRTQQAEPRVPGTIRELLFRNIRAERMMFESSITGIPGHPVEGVALENVVLSYEGGGERDLIEADVPDREVIGKYPEAQMFGRLPAYGLFVRHAQGLSLQGVQLLLEKPDARSAIVFEDVAASRLEAVTGAPSSLGQPLFSFRRVQDILVRRCAAPEGCAVLVRAIGPDAARSGVRLEENECRAAKALVFQTPQEALGSLPLFRESAPGTIQIPAVEMALATPMEARDGAIAVPLEGERDRGTARARFELRERGTYVIQVEALAPSGESDSFYLTIDEREPQTSDLRAGQDWAWDSVRERRDGKVDFRSRSEFALESGVHRLTLRNREPGMRIRMLVIKRLE